MNMDGHGFRPTPSPLRFILQLFYPNLSVSRLLFSKYPTGRVKPFHKILILLGLIGGYGYLLIACGFLAVPELFGRFFFMFLAGAVIALFGDGPSYGTMEPVSFRPICIIVGVMLMGAILVWTFAIKNHI